MESNILLDLLNSVNEIFPLPEGFKGRHSFTVDETGVLCLGIWHKNSNNEIVCANVTFYSEPINHFILQDIEKELRRLTN